MLYFCCTCTTWMYVGILWAEWTVCIQQHCRSPCDHLSECTIWMQNIPDCIGVVGEICICCFYFYGIILSCLTYFRRGKKQKSNSNEGKFLMVLIMFSGLCCLSVARGARLDLYLVPELISWVIIWTINICLGVCERVTLLRQWTMSSVSVSPTSLNFQLFG